MINLRLSTPKRNVGLLGDCKFIPDAGADRMTDFHKEAKMRNGVCNVLFVVFITGVLMVVAPMAMPQNARSRSDSDQVAKYMVDLERQWAESGCTHEPVAEKILADDFQGTAPSGERYDKAKALQRDSSLSERECQLDEAKVYFFGENVAIVYGSERAFVKVQDGTEHERCLVWTDTWLNRANKWQIVAGQDAALPCK